jgi:hypothetical protein
MSEEVQYHDKTGAPVETAEAAESVEIEDEDAFSISYFPDSDQSALVQSEPTAQ